MCGWLLRRKGKLTAVASLGCAHVSGLLVRQILPLGCPATSGIDGGLVCRVGRHWPCCSPRIGSQSVCRAEAAREAPRVWSDPRFDRLAIMPSWGWCGAAMGLRLDQQRLDNARGLVGQRHRGALDIAPAGAWPMR